MPNTIFWSWQSDVAARETREVIRTALLQAIAEISAEFEEAARPEIDQDTKGVPGMPDIVATILEKIEAATVFVGDVTPIAKSESGKHVPNPNVSIELGYAKKALGTSRMILVWNTAILDSKPGDLPFDLRHRRGPISYNLPVGAKKEELRSQREALAKELVGALRSILASVPVSPAPEIQWQATDDNEIAIWKGNIPGLPVNDGGSGPTRVSVDSGSLGYARLIPNIWQLSETAMQILDSATQHPLPLGRFGGLNWGATTGGYIIYRHNESTQNSGITTTATRWFRSTGELWGVDANFIRGEDDDLTYSELYAAERWMAWLKQNCLVCRLTGGDGPYRVRLGIEHLMDVRWARAQLGMNVPQALEERVSYEFELLSDDETIIRQHVREALNRVRDAFGLRRMTAADFETLASRTF